MPKILWSSTNFIIIIFTVSQLIIYNRVRNPYGVWVYIPPKKKLQVYFLAKFKVQNYSKYGNGVKYVDYNLRHEVFFKLILLILRFTR